MHRQGLIQISAQALPDDTPERIARNGRAEIAPAGGHNGGMLRLSSLLDP
jgi:hypothetical protein